MGCLKSLGQFFAMIFLVLCCNRDYANIHLHDYYYVTVNEYGEGYYLNTNPGYSNSPYIENLKSIQWNNRYIVVEQIKEKGTVWFVVKSRDEELVAGNDSIFGPMSLEEKDYYLQTNETGKLNQKKFKYRPGKKFKYSDYVRLSDKPSPFNEKKDVYKVETEE
ncbi:MAG: hypothetical protein LUF90_01320 [Rikenellaceae bacterium]|nr:hypothetical protein [Rikenellaceae bacterium]